MNNYHTQSPHYAAKMLLSDLDSGLSEKEAERRRANDGQNKIDGQKRKSVFRLFFEQLNDFMVLILLTAAGVSLLLSAADGGGSITDSLIILAVVCINAIVGTAWELKAQKSLDALKRLSAPHANVIRSGKPREIAAAELVKGDIITLTCGDIVPADCRITESRELYTDEASLTGESVNSEKSAAAVCELHSPLGDRRNMLYASTFITHGSAKAIVTETGMNTQIGQIASLLGESGEEKTPLQKRLAHIGRILGIAAIVICVLIFIIGLLKKIPPMEIFMTSVSLAVAAIPEGLVAIVTITLALGVGRLSKHNAIIRRLPSVETLGSASVICSDKTGTITQNKMSVVYTYGKNRAKLLSHAALCCEENTKNPTELAILEAAKNEGIQTKNVQRLTEEAFDSDKKYMSVRVKASDKYYLSIIKGAYEKILPKCTSYCNGGNTVPLSPLIRTRLANEVEKAARRGLRLIAAAYREDIVGHGKIPDKGYVFLGLIGLEDPPSPAAHEAVVQCKNAGIIPVMITGDHPVTAKSIAIKCGICREYDEVICGAELDAMSEDALLARIRKCRVYARVTPSHKVRIVRAWQRCGEIVAMTGDGVNDAPALKAADIGCSMGRRGTEVAKDASDMILTDDNFATIVVAVREGREIFLNIKKAIQFLLSSNIGEILAVFAGIAFGISSPLTAGQLLWVNLVTDSLPAIALGLDGCEEDIMHRPPYKGSFLSIPLWANIIFEGMLIGALSLTAFAAGLRLGGIAHARTMAFATLSISELVHAFNMRSERSVLGVLFKNRHLNLSFLLGLLLQITVISVPSLAKIFSAVMLSPFEWLICAFLSAMPLAVIELQKALNRLRRI